MTKEKFKQFKYKFAGWISPRKTYSLRERQLAEDREEGHYSRAKRVVNLPDSYDTRWIRIPKSWKDRWRIKHQYDIPEEDFDSLSKNGSPKKIKKWLIEKYLKDRKFHPTLDTFWREIDELIKEDKIEGKYSTRHYYMYGGDWSLDLTDKSIDIDEFFKKKRKLISSRLVLEQIKLK
jgi:hypothetical protein